MGAVAAILLLVTVLMLLLMMLVYYSVTTSYYIFACDIFYCDMSVKMSAVKKAYPTTYSTSNIRGCFISL